MTIDVSNKKHYLPAALRWLESISSDDKWGLSLDDLAAIFDEDVQYIETLFVKAREHVEIQQDAELIDKIALLIQIHKYLSNIAPSTGRSRTEDWFNQRNRDPLFAGLTIKEYLCVHSAPDSLNSVVRYLAR